MPLKWDAYMKLSDIFSKVLKPFWTRKMIQHFYKSIFRIWNSMSSKKRREIAYTKACDGFINDLMLEW